jgi:hypothetical protein
MNRPRDTAATLLDAYRTLKGKDEKRIVDPYATIPRVVNRSRMPALRCS